MAYHLAISTPLACCHSGHPGHTCTFFLDTIWPPGGAVPNEKGTREDFGSVRFRPSRRPGATKGEGRWQARYTGSDGRMHTARSAGGSPTFETKQDAKRALARVRVEIDAGTWVAPDAPAPAPVTVVTFSAYAEAWLATRTVRGGEPLAVRTREHYDQLLRDHLKPTFGAIALADITPPAVKVWHASLRTGPTAKAQAYGLLRTILGTAVDEGAVAANPCRIRGAGQTKRAREIRPATLSELEAVVGKLPESYRLMALMAAWCALRFGELTELRRSDVDLKAGTVRVARGVVRTRGGGMTIKGPKSDAGKRTVAIPPHLVPTIRSHLDARVTGRDGLLFPSASDPTEHMMNSTMSKVWLAARERAGVPHLRFHDLRHTGAVLAAQTGATLAELMGRLGHSTPAAAMRYPARFGGPGPRHRPGSVRARHRTTCCRPGAEAGA